MQGRDLWFQDLTEAASPVCDCEWMEAEDPLFKVKGAWRSRMGATGTRLLGAFTVQ